MADEIVSKLKIEASSSGLNKLIHDMQKAEAKAVRLAAELKRAGKASEQSSKVSIRSSLALEKSEAKSQAQMDAPRVKNLVYMKNATKGNNTLGGAIGGATKKLATKKLALVAVIGTMVKFTSSATAMAQSMTRFTLATGMSNQGLQKWANSAKIMGASAGTVESTLKNLQLTATNLKFGRGDAAGWSMLGIDPTSATPLDLLDAIAAGLNSHNADVARMLAHDMGVDDDMLAVLKGGRDKTLDVAIISEEDISRLDKFKKEWSTMGVLIQSIATKILAKFLERLDGIAKVIKMVLVDVHKVVNKIDEWRAKMPLVNALFEALGVIIIGIVNAPLGKALGLLLVIKWIREINGHFGKTHKWVKWITAAVVALGVAIWIASAPINIWIALFAAVVLIIEDVVGAFRGMDSVTGLIFNNIIGWVDALKNKFAEFFEWYQNSPVGQFFKNTLDKITGFFGGGGEINTDGDEGGMYSPESGVMSYGTSLPNVAGGNASNNQNETNITINTASDDPQAIAGAVGNEMDKVLATTPRISA